MRVQTLMRSYNWIWTCSNSQIQIFARVDESFARLTGRWCPLSRTLSSFDRALMIVDDSWWKLSSTLFLVAMQLHENQGLSQCSDTGFWRYASGHRVYPTTQQNKFLCITNCSVDVIGLFTCLLSEKERLVATWANIWQKQTTKVRERILNPKSWVLS